MDATNFVFIAQILSIPHWFLHFNLHFLGFGRNMKLHYVKQNAARQNIMFI